MICFSSEESRADANPERIVELPMAELHPFKNHPFKVLDTAESIREHGVLVPNVVRTRKEGDYDIVVVHRRHHASQIAGLQNTFINTVRQWDGLKVVDV